MTASSTSDHQPHARRNAPILRPTSTPVATTAAIETYIGITVLAEKARRD
jgi:hypothetical protein